MEEVVLVDREDNTIGKEEKLAAHLKGSLHRAFSIFIFNTKGEMLIQKRAELKYHSANLWSNSCCSHPKPEEELAEAAKRRLAEELGFKSNVELTWIKCHEYKVEFENGLIEHELDHVFCGITDEVPEINPSEISDFKYIKIDELQSDVNLNSDSYTFWFKQLLDLVIKSYWNERYDVD